MTLRIETTQGHPCTTIRLIGRIHTEHLAELCALLDAALLNAVGPNGPNVLLDLGEVSLVSLEVVRFLGRSESQGIQLLNCPAYIRKWIERERQD